MTNTNQELLTVEQFTDQLKRATQFFTQLEEQKRKLQSEVDKCNEAMCDLDHFLEFGKGTLPANKLMKITSRRQAILLERRQAKYTLELLEATAPQLGTFTKNATNLHNANQKVERWEESQENRKYRLRQLEDLLVELPDKFTK